MEHGSYQRFLAEWRSPAERICGDCREAANRYRRNRERSIQEGTWRFRIKLEDTFLDHLETCVLQWGTSVPLSVVVDSMQERRPEVKSESVRRLVYRLIDRGVVVRERLGDETRYRLNEAGTGG